MTVSGRRGLEGPRGVRPGAPGLGRRPRLPARRGRRPQQGRLRRAAPRRAEGHLRGVHAAGPALLRGPRPDGRARHDRQRPGLPRRRVQRAARRRRRPARLHEALQPALERQGGADEPHHRAGVAVRESMGERGGEGGRPPGLHRALQLVPSAQRVRGPPSHVAHRGCKQPIGTQHLARRDCPQGLQCMAISNPLGKGSKHFHQHRLPCALLVLRRVCERALAPLPAWATMPCCRARSYR